LKNPPHAIPRDPMQDSLDRFVLSEAPVRDFLFLIRFHLIFLASEYLHLPNADLSARSACSVHRMRWKRS